MIANMLSLDVEEWFHIFCTGYEIPFHAWDEQENRVERNVSKVLDMFDMFELKATIFVLGWIAEKYPTMIKEMSKRGHEVASHGYRHALICAQNREEYKKDVQYSKHLLEDLIGTEVIGYRAPGLSPTKDTIWFLDILADSGYKYDSSIISLSRQQGGIEGANIKPGYIQTESGNKIFEIPIPVISLFGKKIGFCTGGYLRLLPYFIIKANILRFNKNRIPVTIYFHPREIDLNHPRMNNIPLKKRFKVHVGLRTMERKLYRLFSDFHFITLKTYYDRFKEQGNDVFIVKHADTHKH